MKTHLQTYNKNLKLKMKKSFERGQSPTELSFVEREKTLSRFKQQLFTFFILLMTAVSGAWAYD